MAESLFDCWFIEGELDYWNGYVQNNKFKQTKVRHNVTLKQAKAWYDSLDVLILAQEARKNGLTPSYYYTIASD